MPVVYATRWYAGAREAALIPVQSALHAPVPAGTPARPVRWAGRSLLVRSTRSCPRACSGYPSVRSPGPPGSRLPPGGEPGGAAGPAAHGTAGPSKRDPPGGEAGSHRHTMHHNPASGIDHGRKYAMSVPPAKMHPWRSPCRTSDSPGPTLTACPAAPPSPMTSTRAGRLLAETEATGQSCTLTPADLGLGRQHFPEPSVVGASSERGPAMRLLRQRCEAEHGRPRPGPR